MDGLLSSLGSDQIAEWMAFYSLEPNPEDRADFRMARIAQSIVQTLVGVNTPKGKKQKSFSLGDFLIDWQAGKRPIDQSVLADKIVDTFKQLGAVVVKRKKKA